MFGTSPDVGNTGITMVGKAGSTVTFTHPNPDAADLLLDVTGSYEWSPDLQNWYQADGLDGPGGITVTTNATADSPAARVTTVVAIITGGDSAELYLRAVATQN